MSGQTAGLYPNYPGFVFGESDGDVSTDDWRKFLWARMEQDPFHEGRIPAGGAQIKEHGLLARLGQSACLEIQDAMPCPMAIVDPLTSTWVGTADANLSEACQRVRQTKTRSLCLACDWVSAREVFRLGTPIVYRCHAGIIDFAIPIREAGGMQAVRGVLIGGQYRSERPEKDVSDELWAAMPVSTAMGRSEWAGLVRGSVDSLTEGIVESIARSLSEVKQIVRGAAPHLTILQRDIQTLCSVLRLHVGSPYTEKQAKLASWAAATRKECKAHFARTWLCKQQSGVGGSYLHTVFPSLPRRDSIYRPAYHMVTTFLLHDEELGRVSQPCPGQDEMVFPVGSESLVTADFFDSAHFFGFADRLERDPKPQLREVPLPDDSFLAECRTNLNLPLAWRHDWRTLGLRHQRFVARTCLNGSRDRVAIAEVQNWGLEEDSGEKLEALAKLTCRMGEPLEWLCENSSMRGNAKSLQALWQEYLSDELGKVAEVPGDRDAKLEKVLGWLDRTRDSLLLQGMGEGAFMHLYVIAASYDPENGRQLERLKQAVEFAACNDVGEPRIEAEFFAQLPVP